MHHSPTRQVLDNETKEVGWAKTSDLNGEPLVEDNNLMAVLSVYHLRHKAVTGVHKVDLEDSFPIDLHERCTQINLRVLKEKFDLVTADFHVLLGNTVNTRQYLSYRMI